MRIIGLMSGTSADGVDACLADIDEESRKIEVRIVAFLTVPYPADVRRQVLEAGSVEDVCVLNSKLGEVFAEAALEACARAKVAPRTVDAIGSHGQTICHMADRTPRSTLQVGEPCVIAQRTGITTVADFRQRDMAAGGGGAPLVPMVDFLLLGDEKTDRVALNIGGIANMTILPAGRGIERVTAFDTGPGNMVIDTLMEITTDGRERLDRGGRTAAGGEISKALLEELLRNDYFHRGPPKSTGRDRFGRRYAEKLLEAGRSRGLSDEDIVATATALTVRSIVRAIRGKSPATRLWSDTTSLVPPELVVSGGGVHNETMMRMIRESLSGMNVVPSDERGIPADAKEALAFAVLAYLTLTNRTGNVPGATGAKEPVILGKIVPGQDVTRRI